MVDYNISAVRRRAVFSGSAGVGPYACTFEILTQTDIQVYKNTTLLTLTTDYTVSINSNGTFGVTLIVAATGSDTVTVAGDRDIARTTDFVTAGDLRASALNDQLDALTIFDQQMSEQGERSIKFPITDSTSLSATLPIAATRANKVLTFDASGNVAVSTEDIGDIEGAATSAAAAAVSAAAALVSENNADASETAAAASALAAAAAAASGLFGTISDKSADFVITADTDNATLFKTDSSGGNINVTLPSIATAGEGERYGFLRVSASNIITLVRNGFDTINGAASNYTLTAIAGEITLILADDASPDNWLVVPWAQATADGVTLTKTAGVLSVKDGGVTGPKLGGGAIGAVGFSATDYSAGTKSSGTFTPDPANGNFQYAVNGGAHTLAPPSTSCSMVIQYTNNGSAGAVTTSGFSKVSGSFTTTNGDDFMCYIARLNGFTHLNIVALQ